MMEAMMKEMMQGLQGEGEDGAAGGDDAEGSGLMDTVMEGLLSRDVLLPSLQELSRKYPPWIEANASTVSAAQMDLYRQQHAYIIQIIALYESHSDKAPTEAVLSLMEKMQELGPPPKELLQGGPADAKLLETLGGDCCVM